jgi:predicted nucleotidyltransferase
VLSVPLPPSQNHPLGLARFQAQALLQGLLEQGKLQAAVAFPQVADTKNSPAGVCYSAFMVNMDTIRAMAEFIVANFDPERVVLFGSYASGMATEDSDVDLLVEVRTDPRPHPLSNPIHHALVKQFMVPTDVFIRTSAAVDEFRNVKDSIIYSALTQGTLLYERPE